MKSRVCRQCGICYLSIAACKGHRQYGCGLEVLGNNVIEEEGEDNSHEEEENYF